MEQYVPTRPPVNLAELPEYLKNELQRIAVVFAAFVQGQLLFERHTAPKKPRFGIYLADGSNWNPGNGRGVYWFDEDSNTFEFLGTSISGGATVEAIQDVVGAMLIDSSTINFIYDDVGNTQTGHVLGIEARTSDPSSPPDGRMWLRTDL